MIGKKAQAGVMDALIFLVVASGAATLLIYIAGAYGASANQQVVAIYNYEFAGNALVALHYATDSDSEPKWFINELKKDDRLAHWNPEEGVKDYLEGYASNVLGDLFDASPTPCIALTFASEDGTEFEYPDLALMGCDTLNRPAYASTVDIYDESNPPVRWTFGVKLYY